MSSTSARLASDRCMHHTQAPRSLSALATSMATPPPPATSTEVLSGSKARVATFPIRFVSLADLAIDARLGVRCTVKDAMDALPRLLAALGLVVAGGGFEDLKALDGEAALEKGKKAFEESSNKYIVVASSAGVLLVDYLANLPVFNLLLPGVLELSGQVLALTILLNCITDRGGGKTQNPADDLVKYTSELPQDFGSLVEPVKTGVLATIDKATSANYGAFPDYVTQKWESVDTKVETGIRGGAALLLLLFSNKLLHLPVLSLLLPKTVELAGVVAALTLVQRYIVDGEDFETDAFGFLQNTLKIPGLLPEETSSKTAAAPAAEPVPAAAEESASSEE
eukprot:jgi/Pico_ML_1/51799/g2646.t1